jgi:hypothetical protein
VNRIHALAASVIVSLAAIFGVAAMATTAGIGQAEATASEASDEVIAARTRKLNRAEAALRRARAKKPPPLPAAPAPAQPRLVAQPAPPAPAWSDDDHDDDEWEDEDEHDDEHEDERDD